MIRIRTLAFAAAFAATACGRGAQDSAARSTPGSAPPKAAVAGDPAIVTRTALDAVQHLQGELAPFEAVDLYARVAGYVREIGLDRGSVVHAGDVIARLDAPELAQQRAESQAKLLASIQTAQRLHAASRTDGAVSTHEMEIADAAVRADSARTDALRDMESYLVVRAPFDGVVTERRVHPGALVGPAQGAGTGLVRLEDHARLRLTVAVPEQLTGVAQSGREISFTVSAWPGETFRGKVSRVSGTVDPKTRTMAIELDVASGGKLTPGMYSDVAWPISRREPSLFVPSGAIVQTTARTYVIRVRGGKAQLVNVSRGVTGTDLTEVFGSLAPGDTVLKRGADDVAEGDAVTLRAPVAKAPVK